MKKNNQAVLILVLLGIITSANADCTSISTCSGTTCGGSSRFNFGNAVSFGGSTYYCCCSNGAMCTTSSTQTECPTPAASPPSPSPPPPSPPPSTSSTPTPTTGDCECTCCTGNYCSSSVVGYLNAGSSSSCTSDACRTTFPSSCPASGSSGSVMTTYSSSSSTPSPSSSSSSGISLNSLLGLISTIFVTIFMA